MRFKKVADYRVYQQEGYDEPPYGDVILGKGDGMVLVTSRILERLKQLTPSHWWIVDMLKSETPYLEEPLSWI